MSRTPANIRYGVNTKLPLIPTLLLGLQHAIAMGSTLVIPAIIVSSISASPTLTMQLVQATMIAMGIGSILIALKMRWLGAGYLCPLLTAPAFLPAALAAVKLGGLPLLYGMALVAGLIQLLLAAIFHKLRKFFPTEVTGIVVMMIGITLIPSGILSITGDKSLSALQWHPNFVLTGFLCLFIMIALTVWGRARLSLYSLVIGAVVGFIISYYLGIFTSADLQTFHKAPLLALPKLTGLYHLKFDPTLVLPFAVAALTVTLKNVGNLITCQKVNDADWVRPEMSSIRRGLFANALSNLFAGFVGGLPNSTSSSNIGLSIATSATSRFLCMSAGILYIVFAFFPKIAMTFAIMPKPVIGAILIYVTAFMLVAGTQIIVSRMIDIRKTFVIGFAIIAGLSVEFAPTFYADLPRNLRYFLDSPIAVSTIVAVFLNLIFRIGVSQTAKLTVQAKAVDLSSTIWKFLQQKGASWSALPDVIRRASQAVTECLEALRNIDLKTDKIHILTSFDEYRLLVTVTYQGELIDLDVKKPSKSEIRHDPAGLGRLAIYMMQRIADQAKIEQVNGKCQIRLGFNQ